MCIITSSQIRPAAQPKAHRYGRAHRYAVAAESYATMLGASPVSKNMGHFQCMEAPKMVTCADKTRVQVLKTNQSGTVCEVSARGAFGHLALKEHAEKLFFHESQLIGCSIENVAVGDQMKFDVVFNPRNQKFLAKNVKVVTPEPIRENSRIGHFQCMEPVKFVPSATPAKMIVLANQVKGVIEELGRDYGYFTADGERVFFHESQLIGRSIEELEIGTALQFKLVFNTISQKKLAEEIRSLSALPENTRLGNFLDMQQSTPVTSPPKPKVLQLGSGTVCGRVTETSKDYGYLEIDDGSLRSDRVFFHSSALIRCGMEDIQVDSKLTCKVVFNNLSKKKVAQEVRLVTPEVVEKPSENMCCEEQQPVVKLNFLQVDSAKFLRRLSEQIVINIDRVAECMDDGESASPLLTLKPADMLQKESISMLVDVLSGRNSRVNSRINSRANSRRGSVY
jgi:cold shock CspA family protein